MNDLKKQTFYVKGMHCPSCELLIEKKLLEIENIKFADASVGKGNVIIEYSGQEPGLEQLNKIFNKDNYIFSYKPAAKQSEKIDFYKVIGIAAIVVVIFYLFNRSGLNSLVNVSSGSSLATFFFFGIIAGISSCAALVGGIVLSMTKQWSGLYNQEDSAFKKMQPNFMFNFGRLISYGLLGAVLGLVGRGFSFSPVFSSGLVIIVSILMCFLGLQMLGVKSLQKFQLRVPKFIIRRVTDETKFSHRYMPFLMGALTFFLPCGFTVAAQGLALLSGNPIPGGLMMLFFALGTTPSLLVIGFSGVKFIEKPAFSENFLKAAGVLVLFFALFNFNSQLNVIGLPSFNNINFKVTATATNQPGQPDDGLAQIIDGRQVLKMNASASGYSPKQFKVRAGIPVRWEITDIGTSGCTNAVVSRNLFDGAIELTSGKTSVKEFTPTKTGSFKFSCWMGMISGTIEVVN